MVGIGFCHRTCFCGYLKSCFSRRHTAEEHQGSLNELLSRLCAVLLYVFHPFYSRGAEWCQGRACVFAHSCSISIYLPSSATSKSCCCCQSSHQLLECSLGLPINLPDDVHQRNPEQNHPSNFQMPRQCTHCRMPGEGSGQLLQLSLTDRV